jgi:hypothetical protein
LASWYKISGLKSATAKQMQAATASSKMRKNYTTPNNQYVAQMKYCQVLYSTLHFFHFATADGKESALVGVMSKITWNCLHAC